MKKILILSISLFLVALIVVGTAFAGSSTSNGITLSFPDYPLKGPGLQSCEPWNDSTANTVTLTGIPEGASVKAAFAYAAPFPGSPITLQPPVNYSNVTGGSLVIPVVYPTDVTAWPVYDSSTGERAISIAAMVQVNSNGVTTKLASKHWWVRCLLPQPQPAQGCSPGYWRQDQHFDSWAPTGYTTAQNYSAVFGVSTSFNSATLLETVQFSGGGERALARHATAALLNASHPDVNFEYSPAQVITGVQQAYASGDFETFKDELDIANNAGCSLD